MLGLGEVHYAGGKLCIKPERARNLHDSSVPRTPTDLRNLPRKAIMARRWIRNYAGLACPLPRSTGLYFGWWRAVQELSFTIVKNRAATATLLHGWDLTLTVEMYVHAFKFAAGCHIRQLQNGVRVPLLYDLFAFSLTEQKHDTYRLDLDSLC